MAEIKPIARFVLFGKPRDTYYVVGLLSILFINLLLIPVYFWAGYHWFDVITPLLIGLGACYVFNVIRAFLNVPESYSFYHYYLLTAMTTVCYGLFTAKNLLMLGDLFAICMSFISCLGRVGCFHAGCCYGKPVRKNAAFWLFPTQLSESFLSFCCFSTGIILIGIDVPDGFAFVILTVAYSFGRFLLEFKRGDKRAHFLSVSEAQWTGFLITISLLFIPIATYGIIWSLIIGILILEFSCILWLIGFHLKMKDYQKKIV